MSKRVIDIRSQSPLLDIVSYARGRVPLTPTQRAYIARTVRRVPEVVVKVSGGARTLAGVERHMKYVEKKGEFGLETDMNTRAGGAGFASDLVRDWDLDVEALNHYSKKSVRGKPPRLVHNIIFSMPAGTSPPKVLEAVRRLALNEWALENRYAMALHTDTPRPHVHVVVKAVSEQGTRLNIRKDTLRKWRAQFAANLRELGVAANATERAVRGQHLTPQLDGIYRTARRGESTHMVERASELRYGGLGQEVGKSRLTKTRKEIKDGWLTTAAVLSAQGHAELAADVRRFVDHMPPPKTENEQLAVTLVERSTDVHRAR